MAQVNVNIEELKRMAAMIAAEQIKMQNGNNAAGPNKRETVLDPEKVIPKQPQQKITHKSQPKSQVVVNSDSTSDIANIIPTKSTGDPNDGQMLDNQQGNGDNMLGILGFSIPKQTLYFLLILVVIAVTIWYMSRDTKSGKKKRRHDEDE